MEGGLSGARMKEGRSNRSHKESQGLRKNSDNRVKEEKQLGEISRDRIDKI